MSFDYESQTKGFYKNSEVASDYHRAFTAGRGFNAWRFRFIAARERAAVQRLLSCVPHATVIDLPAGTGKMAPVYKALGCDVLAADVSDDMLDVARNTYREAGCDNVRFVCVDLENADEAGLDTVDTLVCIRLMHRVPSDVKHRMLRQIARHARHAVVSFAVDSPYQRLRLLLRAGFIDTPDVGLETRQSRRRIEAMLDDYFLIRRRRPIARLASSEWVYLLESRLQHA